MHPEKHLDAAKTLVAADKVLLAMDESNPTCNRRFARLGILETEDARRAYREMRRHSLLADAWNSRVTVAASAQ
jgi:fructose-bisphosphate aldolase class I